MPEPNNSVGAGATNAGTTPAEKKLLAGKYENEVELERGYMNQQAETMKIIQQRDEAQRQLEVLMPLIAGNPNGGNAGGAPSARPSSALDKLAEATNADRDLLAAAIAEVAAPVADARFAPVAQGFAARQSVVAEIPDFAKFEPEVAQHLQANPRLNKQVQDVMKTAPEAGMKLAFYEWQRNNSAAQTKAAMPGADTTGATALNARLDALMPRGAGGREANTVSASQAAVVAAFERGRETGDMTEYLRLTMVNENDRA